MERIETAWPVPACQLRLVSYDGEHPTSEQRTLPKGVPEHLRDGLRSSSAHTLEMVTATKVA
jgi:hypothetical protein